MSRPAERPRPPLYVLAALLLLAPPGRAAVGPDKFALDSDRLHFALVEWDAPVRSEDRNHDEFEAYNDTVLHARQFAAADLIAAGSRDVTFRDLVRPGGKDYQYKLLTMDGRLKRVRRVEPSLPLKAAGVTDLYECWVFPTDGSDPLCLLTAELPEGLQPRMEFAPARRVTFAGYYFKLIQYESSAPNPKTPERNVVRRAPLLVGRGFTVEPEPSADGGRPWREGFFPALTALVGGIAAVGLGLTLWFRRGDRALRATLDERRRQNPFGATKADET